MRPLIICTAFAAAIVIPTFAQAKDIIEKTTLQPNESKEVVVETKEKIKIGWEHVEDKGYKQCKNFCIELKNPANDLSFSQDLGGSMGIEPQDGKAVAVLKNLESVPLEIVIFKKPAKK